MSDAIQKLKNYCSIGKIFNKKALIILESDDNLDLASEDGLVFKYAVKHGNSELLGALLKYYETHNLQDDRNSVEYKTALLPLRKILDDLKYCYNLKEKGVDQILSSYLALEEEDEQVIANLDAVFEEDVFSDHNGYTEQEQQVPEFRGRPEDLLPNIHCSGDGGVDGGVDFS